jgi:hypothetical protein
LYKLGHYNEIGGGWDELAHGLGEHPLFPRQVKSKSNDEAYDDFIKEIQDRGGRLQWHRDYPPPRSSFNTEPAGMNTRTPWGEEHFTPEQA